MNKSTGALFYNKDKNLEIMDFYSYPNGNCGF